MHKCKRAGEYIFELQKVIKLVTNNHRAIPVWQSVDIYLTCDNITTRFYESFNICERQRQAVAIKAFKAIHNVKSLVDFLELAIPSDYLERITKRVKENIKRMLQRGLLHIELLVLSHKNVLSKLFPLDICNLILLHVVDPPEIITFTCTDYKHFIWKILRSHARDRARLSLVQVRQT